MGHRVKMLPHLSDGHIFFQFRSSDASYHALFLECMIIFIEYDGSDPLVLIIWMDTDQIENNILAVSLGTQQMKDTEGEQLTVGFLKGFGE